MTDPITRLLQSVYREISPESGGEVATYIPELARADPGHFGIALVSLGGGVYLAGDTAVPFTIQSVSKPFVYALALAERGVEAVFERVGVEPSGESFNAISLESGSGRPDNAMINAGAIVTTSLIDARNSTERFERILATLSRFAGRVLDVDEAVYRSEIETGDRNRALAYLMRDAGSLHGDVDEVLDVYFRQCAIRATAVDIAVMAATLANGGTNPLTGEAVVDRDTANFVLAVMATCGMYDASGGWLVRVGLPAKSGVSGGIVAASPGEFGIGVYSPRLDRFGNSVRGVEACKQLADQLGLHVLSRPARHTPAVYATEPGEMSSGWIGAGEQEGICRTVPDRVVVRALQGVLTFADGEALMRSLSPSRDAQGSAEPLTVVLDLHRVDGMMTAAGEVLNAYAHDLAAAGHVVRIVDRPGRRLIDAGDVFPSLDAAVHARDHPASSLAG